VVALVVVAILVVAMPWYVATNREGVSGIGGLNGPGGNLFGSSYIPVLPLGLAGILALVWNPCWRRLSSWWSGAGCLVVRGRELLLLVAVLYAVTAAWDPGRLRSLFINEVHAQRDGQNPTWSALRQNFPTMLGVPAEDWSRGADPPDEAAIRLSEGLQKRGDATLPDPEGSVDGETDGWRAAGERWRALTTPRGPPERRRSPLAVAAQPVVGSVLLILVMAVVVFGIVGMTGRQWTHHERLQYPLLQVPLALAQPSLIRSRGFRLAVIGVVAVVFYNLAHAEGFHPLPVIPYGGGDYGFREPIVRMQGLHEMFGLKMPSPARWVYTEFWGAIYLSPVAIGLAFILKGDVGFSLWGGFFFGAMICGWLYRAGIPVNYMHHGQTAGGGAALTMAGVILWIGRHHYWRLLGAAIGIGRQGVTDRAGVWGVRCILLGGALFSLLMVLLLYGFDPYAPSSLGIAVGRMEGGGLLRATGAALVCLLLVGAIVIISSRIVAETGFALLELPIRFWEMMLVTGLPFFFPIHALVLMSWIGNYLGRTHTNPAGFLIQARAMGEEAGIPDRRIYPVLFGVVAFAALVGTLVLIVAWWVAPGSPVTFIDDGPVSIVNACERSRQTDSHMATADSQGGEWGLLRNGIAYFGFLTDIRSGPLFYAFLTGVGLVLACFVMRRLWVRFPFHPLGIVIGLSWPIYTVWGSLLIGWLAKVLVLRYGGAQLYARLKPVAIGLIFGEVLAQGLRVAWRSLVYYI
jgi:hypothetical protein